VVGLRVAHPPVLPAKRSNFEVKATTIGELVDFVAGLGGFDPEIGEGWMFLGMMEPSPFP
jgi:hypothetical protein